MSADVLRATQTSRVQEYAPIPGPVDQISFTAEQRRRRQQSWRLTAVCAVSIVLLGIPLSMVVTPLVFLVVLVPLKISNAFLPVPHGIFDFMRRAAGLIPAAVGSVLDPGSTPVMPLSGLIAGALLMLVPGMLVMAVIWFILRRLFLAAGTGGVLLALNARAPRQEDVEERRLVNVTEEIGIAAGLPPPKLMLIDEPFVNAAMIGSSPADATVVVTRKLLDACNRDETQGIIAHLVGSSANGDLRIALTILSVFCGFGLVLTVFEALFGWSGSAWRELLFTLRWAVHGRRHPMAAEGIAKLLSSSIGRVRNDNLVDELIHSDDRSDQPRSWLGRVTGRFPVLQFVFLPIMLLYLVVLLVQFQVFLLKLVIVDPWIVFLWRTRRYLADSTAVQLTRNPDGLASALRRLQQDQVVMPNGQWASHLFIVGNAKPCRSAGESGQFGSTIAPHPPTDKRLRRLAAQGARLERSLGPSWRSRLPHMPLHWLLLLIFVPLFLLMASLMFFVIVVVSALAGAAALFFVGAVMLIIERFLL